MIRRFFTAAAVAVAALVAPATSKADFTLTLSTGSGSSLDSMTIDFSNSSATTVTALTINGTAYSLGSGTTLANAEMLSGTVISGGSIGTIGNGYSLNGLTFNKYNVDANALTNNSPGTGSNGYIQLVPSTITNSGTTAALNLSLTQTGYTAPTGDQFLVSSISDNLGSAAPDGVIVTGQTNYTGAGIINMGPQIGVADPNYFNLSGYANSGDFVSSTGYSLSTSVTIAGLTGGTLGSITINEYDYANGGGPITPFGVLGAPAPSGLVIAATMAPFLFVLRRRMNRLASENAAVA